MTLVDELRAADHAFHRPAVPAVFAEYRRFMESGRYPYIDTVVKAIAASHDVPADLRKPLEHEVYLARGEWRLAEMVDKETNLAGDGFRPITQLVPVNGAKVRLPNGTVYRLKNAGHDWALLPPGKRTNGLSLNGLVGQHRAFEAAKASGQVAMNNPQVRMFAEVS